MKTSKRQGETRINTNKSSALKFFLSCISCFSWLILLFANCSLNQSQVTDKSTLTINIANTSVRAIMPEHTIDQFERFVFVFHPAGTITAANEASYEYVYSASIPEFNFPYASSNTYTIQIDPDEYDLAIIAFFGPGITNEAAIYIERGVDLSSGGQTTKTITLEPYAVTKAGNGTFEWDITITPALPATGDAKMTITPLSGGTPEKTYNLLDSDDPDFVGLSGTLSLIADYYTVTFNLSRDAHTSPVNWYQVLHVYRNMTSEFKETFTDDHFNRIIYTVTYVYGYDSIADGKETVFSGGKAPNLTPSRSGYKFDGWYTDETFSPGTKWDFDTPITKNETLYAKWEQLGEFTPNPITVVNPLDISEPSLVDTVLFKTGYGNPNSHQFALTPSTYSEIKWYLNDTLQTAANNSESFTLNADDHPSGTYFLTVEVIKDNVPYNKTITVNIPNVIKSSSAVSMEMVWIPAGTFTMGSPITETGRMSSGDGNEIQRQVTLTAGFYMGKYEVTQTQYQAVMGTNPSYFKTAVSEENAANLPVEMLSFYDAILFCNRLSIKEGLTPAYQVTGVTDWETAAAPTVSNTNWDNPVIVAGSNGYRLPTEAQWEYACRAGTTTAYNTGNTITDNTGWYVDNSSNRTHEVGKKPPNAWGLYDMHGNVFEKCWDRFGAYESGAQTDPMGPSTMTITDRIIRGGGWQENVNDSYVRLRSASRVRTANTTKSTNTGLRVIRPGDNLVPAYYRYFGTFIAPPESANSGIIIVDKDKYTRDRPEYNYTLENLTWEVVTNTSATTQADFPTGYRITGTVTEKTGTSTIVTESLGQTATIHVYLKTDGTAIREQASRDNTNPAATADFLRQP